MSQPNTDMVELPARQYRRVRILLIGLTGAGKSSFINKASGSDLQAVGKGLLSKTKELTRADSFVLDDYKVELIDTPGFDDTVLSPEAVMKRFAEYFTALPQDDQSFNGVIYVHDLTRPIDGTSLRAFETFKQLCGEDAMPNATIMLSKEELVASGAEDRRNGIKEKFKSALDAGAILEDYDNTTESAHRILLRIASLDPKRLQFVTDLPGDENGVSQTTGHEALVAGSGAPETAQKSGCIRVIRGWFCC